MLGKLLPWKKKKEDEEEDEELEERKPKKKRRKKKKKKPEPWGKKERIMVFSVLLLTVLASGFASLKSGNLELSDFDVNEFNIPSFNFFQEETIVLYGTQDEEKDPSQLINAVLDRTQFLEGEYAFVVLRLDTGFRYGVNDDRILPAASLVKLPVMAAMFKAEEEDKIDFYEEYTLRSADKVSGSGILSNEPEGYQVSYKELIRLMGEQSDNTAYNISKSLAGTSMVNEILTSANMENTSVNDNLTTADDIANFFENLWESNLINSDHRDEMLGYLTDTIYEDWITKGVPEQVRVSHKYGTLDDVVNDAGIVFATDPYVLVILSDGVVREEANIVIPEISRMIYEFETS